MGIIGYAKGKVKDIKKEWKDNSDFEKTLRKKYKQAEREARLARVKELAEKKTEMKKKSILDRYKERQKPISKRDYDKGIKNPFVGTIGRPQRKKKKKRYDVLTGRWV